MTNDATVAGTAVSLIDLCKRYGNVVSLHNLSLSIAQGEFLTLLGPSGCGKSTTLKIIAGLLPQDSGEIYFGDRRIDMLPPNRRNIGLVFQNYALFPHMTVRENVAFSLRMRRWSKARQRDRVADMLNLVRLEGLADRKPAQLSGGQQQRVAVARALAFAPDLVLLDEPLSNLDAKLREEVRLDLRKIQKQAQQTTVFVTHDQVEALAISDRIVLMNAGRVEQIATPAHLYNEPATEFAARFVGANNLIAAELARDDAGAHARIHGIGRIALSTLAEDISGPRTPIWVCIRPESIAIMPDKCEGTLSAKVLDLVFQGTSILIELAVEGLGLLRAEIPARSLAHLAEGQDVQVSIMAAHAVRR